MNVKFFHQAILLCAVFTVGAGCKSGGILLQDPSGDDNGPGSYVYPTDKVYGPGAFDLQSFKVVPVQGAVEFHIELGRDIQDPWDSKSWGGNGFSLQMASIHIDTDHVAGSGVQEGLPGTNVRFSAEEAWDRLIIVSPQGPTRIHAEIQEKAAKWKDRIVVPSQTRALGRTLIAVVSLEALGGVPAESWGYQVLMQSNDGAPASSEFLNRKVDKVGTRQRFGGGSDYNNDPHVIDILIAPAQGTAAEAQGQHDVLSRWSKQATEPRPEDLVLVPMVYPAP